MSSMRPVAERRATILGMAAILLWSTTVAFGRSLTEQLGPLTSAALIYGLGGLLGWGYWRVTRSTPRLAAFDRRYLLGCGGLFLLYMVCFYLALGTARNRTQVLGVGLMNYLWPMLTLVFSLVLLKIRANALFAPGVLAGMAGVFLVTTQGDTVTWTAFRQNMTQNATPYTLGFLAAVSWGLYSALSRRWGGGARPSQSRADSGAVPIFMLLTGVVLGLARLLVPEHTHWTGRALGELAYLAVGPNLAYMFWEQAMQKGDIILVASCSYFTPLLSTLISSLYLGVSLGWSLWGGCGLIIVGAILCNLAVRPSPVGTLERGNA
jgi:drug/metabolite transporter (DMT)-like permease